MSMALVLLNGEYLPQEQAKISPMDRGFLFGDGIYEVIPCYGGKPVGLTLHLERMNRGLTEIGIKYAPELDEWQQHIECLQRQVNSDSVGIYIHISRGTDTKRFHAYPQNVAPTVFAYAFEIPPSQSTDREVAKGFKVVTVPDLRWQRCHIKSTSLLGNVMHFQQGQDANKDEVILYNQQGFITEAAACNVFVVQNDQILTPKLDNQLLPGITRQILISSLEKHGGFNLLEKDIPVGDIKTADEVWITSSSKEIGAVIEVDGDKIGDGKPGAMWQRAQQAYNQYKFSF